MDRRVRPGTKLRSPFLPWPDQVTRMFFLRTDFTQGLCDDVRVDCPSGGHTTEILRLMESLSAVYTPRHYVIADTDRMSEDKIRTFEASRQSAKSQVRVCHSQDPFKNAKK